MIAEQFIDRLEQQGLLDAKVVAELRRRVAKIKDKKVTPEAIAKFLVDKGHLTRFQATKLVSDVTGLGDKAGTAKADPDAIDDDDMMRFASDEEVASAKTRPLDTEKRPQASAADAAAAREAHELDDLTSPVDDSQELASPRSKKRERSPQPTEPPVDPVVPEPPVDGLEELGTESLIDDDLGADLEAGGKLLPGAKKRSGLRGLFGGSGDDDRSAGRSDVRQHRSPAPVQRKLQPTSQWDSKLLLIGGASLGVLLVIGAFLFMSLTRGSADEMFAAASEDYRAGSYSQAIKRYDRYLDAYPNDKNASLARVRTNMARLWQVSGDPERGLRVAKEILPTIEGEESVGEAREELASLLPGIAEGFLEKAKLSQDTGEQEDLLAKTEDAMTLVNNPTYIPSTLRKSQLTRIDTISDDIARVQRDIDRETQLVDTVRFILTSVDSGNTQAAYDARYELLNKYPGLDTNDELHEAVLKITEKERERVEVVEEPIAPATDDHVSSDAARVVLANRSGQPHAGASGHVTYILAGGSVFGIDATNGDVLWRRFVGFETSIEPFPLTSQEDADAIAVDSRRNELLRLEARTGKLVWRLPVGESFAEPVVSNNQLLVSANSGKVLQIDSATGKCERHVLIPQAINVGPGVDRRRPQFYQLGEHDNLYVMSADTLECREVYYIGHKPGTVVVPPVMALGYLFVVENAGPDYAMLHILATDENGLRLRTAQKSIRVQGRVVTTPIVSRRRILVVTDRRAIELYDVDPNNEAGTPVTTAASQSATAEAPIISYALLDRGYLWVANNRYTKLQVQASTGKLPSEWVQDETDVYVSPLRLVRDVVVSVHRRQGTEGVTVSATPINEKMPSWQTELAVPIRQVHVNGDQIQALNARGQLYDITPDDVAAGKISQAALRATEDPRQMLFLAHAEPLDATQWVLSPSKDYTQVVFYEPGNAQQRLRLLQTTVPPDTAAVPPVAFGGGLLIPQIDGQVSLVDPVTGAERLHAFHPEIAAGSKSQWVLPAVLGDGGEFAIADNRRRLYRVAVKNDPEPHLAEMQNVDVKDPLVGRLASVGQVCYGVMRSGGDDLVACFTLPNLTAAQQWPLEGRVTYGPERVGDVVLVASDEQMMCVDADQKQRWVVSLEHGALAGPPVMDNSSLFVAFIDGTVASMNAASGEVTASLDVGEPLASGVIRFGDQLLVATRSATLFVIAIPQP